MTQEDEIDRRVQEIEWVPVEKCSLCSTATKYEYFNKKFHTKSCECGCYTRLYDLKGNLLKEMQIEIELEPKK